MFSIKNRIGRFLPYSIKSLLLTIFGYFNFKRYVLLNKPYFGHYLSSGQTWSERRDIMRKLLENEISKSKSKDYKILEIGSWGGQSAILWGLFAKDFPKEKYSVLILGRLLQTLLIL